MSMSAKPSFLALVTLLSGALSGCATSGGPGGAGQMPAMPSTVSGGFLSGALGEGLDAADRQRGYDAELSALETGGPGYPIGWKGESGARGTVIAGPAYRRPGFQNCRDYSHTIYVKGRPQIARGAACKTDGHWQAVS
ncbi:hypothetical protein ACT6QH_09095 [Xanthobacter sp. TB0139]|uniref:hypothetical protein n=1 Tax=Xanthobacter sp. TB0139 TaxID=3459178 RepID=UPI004039A1EC